jgi:hypothetical protein
MARTSFGSTHDKALMSDNSSFWQIWIAVRPKILAAASLRAHFAPNLYHCEGVGGGSLQIFAVIERAG